MEKITILNSVKYKGYELKYHDYDKTVSVNNPEHYITTTENLLQAFQLVDYLTKAEIVFETVVWEE